MLHHILEVSGIIGAVITIAVGLLLMLFVLLGDG